MKEKQVDSAWRLAIAFLPAIQRDLIIAKQQLFLETIEEENLAPIPDMALSGQWLTIGDAPSFMLSKKNAERLREFVNLVEEAQMGGGGTNAK